MASNNGQVVIPPILAPHAGAQTQYQGQEHVAVSSSNGGATRSPRPPSAMTSPCFVHSQLQGASFADFHKAKQAKQNGMPPQITTYPEHPSPSDSGISESGYMAWEDEDDSASSLTKQLAETAVGVREMSKQLGQNRVQPNIQSVLIVTKARDNRLIKLTRELALYLMLKPSKTGRGMIVYVDNQLKKSRRFDAAGIEHDHPELFLPFPRRRASSSSSLASMSTTSGESTALPEGQLRYWTADMCSRSPHLFDFVVTLGGDGTVLFTSWLFQRIVPPVLPFALGSLGFLTNFDFNDHQAVMDNVIDAGIRVNLRMRFTCTVYRAVAPEEDKRHKRRAVKKGDTGEIMMKNLEKSGWEAVESGFYPQPYGTFTDGKCPKDKEIMCFTTRPVETFEVINDLVVDRGPSPYVSLLELFGDEHHLTTVQADGLTISTPTGSTAYSLSAGGSLVHPEIPAMLITPICPHTLSFRPMLLPDTMELRICVPFNSRSTAWASFDGRGRVELKQGDHIKVTASKYPFPTVCSVSQSNDWFNSISRTLKWNERERQKSFVVVEEGPAKHKKKSRRESVASSIASSPLEAHVPEESVEDEEEDEVSDGENQEEDEDEEDEKFDIDDLSSTDSPGTSTAKADSALEASKPSPLQEAIGKEKAKELISEKHHQQAMAEMAAQNLLPRMPKGSRSRSRGRSGLETPDRFAGPHPHPPRVSPRHVQFLTAPSTSSSSSSVSTTVNPNDRDRDRERDATARVGERGAWDDLHSPRSHLGTRSRIPKDRDVEGETLKTPTLPGVPSTTSGGRRRAGHERSRERDANGPHARRAFAVWGQDESDSATSDSDL